MAAKFKAGKRYSDTYGHSYIYILSRTAKTIVTVKSGDGLNILRVHPLTDGTEVVTLPRLSKNIRNTYTYFAEKELPIECKLVYGLDRNHYHTETVPAVEAFKRLPHLRRNWMYVNIYHGVQLVYTTQGVTGHGIYCSDCPYIKREEK